MFYSRIFQISHHLEEVHHIPVECSSDVDCVVLSSPCLSDFYFGNDRLFLGNSKNSYKILKKAISTPQYNDNLKQADFIFFNY